jgi:uncharacterized glyoxalase superfamily protein PhnB
MALEMSFVTLGARDLPTLRRFYQRWGWRERPGASDTFAAFDAGDVRLALYPMELLGIEAAPGEPSPPVGWNGVTLAVNLAERSDVEREIERAVACGASPLAAPVEREWGGYSGYVADPEGNRWEIAWPLDP